MRSALADPTSFCGEETIFLDLSEQSVSAISEELSLSLKTDCSACVFFLLRTILETWNLSSTLSCFQKVSNLIWSSFFSLGAAKTKILLLLCFGVERPTGKVSCSCVAAKLRED